MSTEKLQKLSPKVVATLLQNMGYRGKVVLAKESCFVESSASGLHFRVQCLTRNGSYAVTETDLCDAIRFYGGWSDLPQFDERHLADFFSWFHSEIRFAKVYRVWREPTIQLRIEADWLVKDGITAEAFEYFANKFFDVYNIVRDSLHKIRAVDYEAISHRHNQAINCVHGRQANNALAAELYRENGDAGYAGSQNNLGDLYERGLGVSQNLVYAVYWYARAAERGEPTAYLSLAEVLSASSADPDVLVDAGKFALLAAERLPDGRNKTLARGLIDAISRQLSEQDWSRAIALAQSFEPLHQESRLLSDAPEPTEQLTFGYGVLH